MDDLGRRWYVLDSGDKKMSVTTILGHLKEDKTGLHYWQKKHNGRGDAADHRHLFWYMGRRGTLCHYQALKKFEHVFDSDDQMWGDNEKEALGEVLAEKDNHYIIYSQLKYKGEVDSWEEFNHRCGDVGLDDVLMEDQKFFAETFDEVCDKLGINEDSVIAVEKYLFENDVGYGGQCDLLYEDPDGKIVLADLKTSGGLRQKHIIQGVAYSKAVEQADDIPVDHVDRIEVIRIHPDTKTWEVHSHEEASEYHTTKYWFKDKYGNWEYDSLEEMWQTFIELADKAHGGN